ncbi:MAG: MnhB domain-containing protein [Halobacteriales archaeon]
MNDESVRSYTESPVVTTTTRVVVPFALTYGVYVVLHGADSPGGGFQGGAIAASTLIMVAFGFGVEPTARWLNFDFALALAVVGVLGFMFAALASVALGHAALALDVLPLAMKYAIEAIEIAIGAVVTGVVTLLFMVMATPREET